MNILKEKNKFSSREHYETKRMQGDENLNYNFFHYMTTKAMKGDFSSY